MQKTMNDVVFVMANSRLNKKKEVRKANDYSIEDLSSDDDWIVEENDENSDMNTSESDEDIVELGEDVGGSGAPEDVPIEDDNDEEVGDAIDENKDNVVEEDDYPQMGMNSLDG